MSNDPNAVLRKSLSDVFERFGYMFANGFDESGPSAPGADSFLRASITFQGEPASGRICLSAPAPLCDELAANILGVDASEIGAREREDSIKEILNIACGEFLEGMFGGKPVFDLTVPTVAHAAWDDVSASPVALSVEDRPVFADVSLSRPPAA